MKKLKTTALIVGGLLTTGGVQQAAYADIVIDDFTDIEGTYTLDTVAGDVAGDTAPSPLSPTALTGLPYTTRTLQIEMGAGAGNINVFVANGAGYYDYANSFGISGIGRIQYTEASPGADLRAGGEDTFYITVDGNDHPETIDITVTDDDGDSGSAAFTGINAPGTYQVSYASFSNFANLDFDTITDVDLEFAASGAQDLQISEIGVLDNETAGLTIVKTSTVNTGADACLNPNESIDYVVTVTNPAAGGGQFPEVATNVSISDALSAGATIDCASVAVVGGSVNSCDDVAGTIDLDPIASLADGASVQLSFTADIDAATANGTVITNTATADWEENTGAAITDTVNDTVDSAPCDVPDVDPAPPVPTMGEWGMGIMTVSLSLIGLFGVRRRMRS